MIVVAIDGPSGAGKSSTAKAVAKRAGWSYLDTGALYRAMTWLALRENIESADEILAALKRFPLRFVANPANPEIFVGDVNVNNEIRSENVTNSVSKFSAIPELRAELLNVQRKFIASADRGIVVEGRDIGTVVAPDAALKIYLQADIEARAQRRSAETDAPTDSVGQALAARDELDSTRATSPLAKAMDAVVIDSTELTLEETADWVWELLKERSLLGLPIVAILGRPNVGNQRLSIVLSDGAKQLLKIHQALRVIAFSTNANGAGADLLLWTPVVGNLNPMEFLFKLARLLNLPCKKQTF